MIHDFDHFVSKVTYFGVKELVLLDDTACGGEVVLDEELCISGAFDSVI